MILSTERYAYIYAFLQRLILQDLKKVSVEDALILEVPFEVLLSIQGQIVKRYLHETLGDKLYGNDRIKKTIRMYIETERIAETPPESSSVVLSMSQQAISAVPYHYRSQDFPSLNTTTHPHSIPFPSPTMPTQPDEMVRDISTLLALCPYNIANLYLKMRFPTESKMSVSNFLSNSKKAIPEPIPRENLFYLIGSDPMNAPDIQLSKEISGREFEAMLERLLHKRHMEFETEDDSRRKGRQKTPDILFTIPMAVRLPAHHCGRASNSAQSVFGEETRRTDRAASFDLVSPPNSATSSAVDGATSYMIVNWIDSKALFADYDVFAENLTQFQSYTNRFGRGMVIYWHGFCENVLSHTALAMNDNIIVCDAFPEDWLFPTGESADGRQPAFDSIVLNDCPDQMIDFDDDHLFDTIDGDEG